VSSVPGVDLSGLDLLVLLFLVLLFRVGPDSVPVSLRYFGPLPHVGRAIGQTVEKELSGRDAISANGSQIFHDAIAEHWRRTLGGRERQRRDRKASTTAIRIACVGIVAARTMTVELYHDDPALGVEGHRVFPGIFRTSCRLRIPRRLNLHEPPACAGKVLRRRRIRWNQVASRGRLRRQSGGFVGLTAS